MTRRTIAVGPHSEMIIPARLVRRHQKTGNTEPFGGMCILESTLNSHLRSRGLLVGSVLVDVGRDGQVPVRVMNLSEDTQVIGAQSLVALARPVGEVCLDDLSVITPHSEGSSDCRRTMPQTVEAYDLPGPLHDLWQRSAVHLSSEESRRVAQLLFEYQHAFSFSEFDLGRTKR